MTKIILQLTGAGALPVLFAVLFYWAERKTSFGQKSFALRQFVIGLCFGGLAVFSTEFGIPVDGAVINVRNAAPLTAGLIFGWPAGILAGLIGGIERWFSVYWGVGEFTRMACTVGTIIAGFLGAAVRRFMMDNKKSSWFYGLAIGIVTEVLHMLMVFIFNSDDIARAFNVVKHCALPMITANGLSVMLALAIITHMGRKGGDKTVSSTRKISQTFQRWLLICVLGAFSVTLLFSSNFQTELAEENTQILLEKNIGDVREDITEAADALLLDKARQIANELPEHPTRDDLVELALRHNVTEISLINTLGVISQSTNAAYKGYNMAVEDQSAEFLCLLEGEKEFVQSYQPMSLMPNISRKYAGVALEGVGFVQVGYDVSRFQKGIQAQVVYAAKNRHIGQDGYVIVCDESGRILSDRHGNEGQYIDLKGNSESEVYTENTCFLANINDEECFCMYSKHEGYYILTVLPKAEAMYTRDVAVYVLAFMETIVFAALFAHIFFLIKKLIVENIQKINRSLAQITSGDLSVTVNVRSNEEFSSLSDDINTTVETLRHYIDEAAARIDKELEFAQQIQRSALPSVFPPFPNRTDFSIFASMDPAKEVGGDFYDFYLLGEKQLAFLIADVSGKGIPAAMFMMTAKTMIKGLVEGGNDVAETFTKANSRLCEGNEAGMFVTAWLGVLNLETGLLSYVNAGHNPPVIQRANGEYEYHKSRAGFVLAGMDGIRYRKQELELHPGDTIFLYTDGVTEAQDLSHELFGEDRLLLSLNTARANSSVEEICKTVRKDVDVFVREADQFDDMTMLCVRLNPIDESEIIRTVPDMASVAAVSEFMDLQIEQKEIPLKIGMRLKIAVDEIYSNIVRYSNAEAAELRCTLNDGTLTLQFSDDGAPYNPLDTKEPDVTASAEEREIGGLGIFMVRKMMDSVDYEFSKGMNRLTLTIKV
ncbi:MAG: SpoIIE family protein phosphatase [Eubacteriales bacterium]|nr:SpoIIE family protein phosphatase [Eubacteriales bacterium]